MKDNVAWNCLQNESELQYLSYLNCTQAISGMSGNPSVIYIYASYIFKPKHTSAIFSKVRSYTGGWLLANLQLIN